VFRDHGPSTSRELPAQDVQPLEALVRLERLLGNRAFRRFSHRHAAVVGSILIAGFISGGCVGSMAGPYPAEALDERSSRRRRHTPHRRPLRFSTINPPAFRTSPLVERGEIHLDRIRM
jgi:hypothetical protein